MPDMVAVETANAEIAQAEASASVAAEAASAAIAASQTAAALAEAGAAATVAEVREDIRDLENETEQNEESIQWLRSRLDQTETLCATMGATLTDQSLMLASIQEQLTAMRASTPPVSEPPPAEVIAAEVIPEAIPASANAEDRPEAEANPAPERRKHRAI